MMLVDRQSHSLLGFLVVSESLRTWAAMLQDTEVKGYSNGHDWHLDQLICSWRRWADESMLALRGKLNGSIVPTAKSIFTLHDVMKITDGEPCHNSVLWKEDITR
jgi:hypothetical protein